MLWIDSLKALLVNLNMVTNMQKCSFLMQIMVLDHFMDKHAKVGDQAKVKKVEFWRAKYQIFQTQSLLTFATMLHAKQLH
jgi:hypothetical protein